MTTVAGDGPNPARGPARRRGRPIGHTGDETRAAVIATAQRLFGEAGYRGVSMEALATECGLNARALYYHFASKRELFDAAADDAFARFGGVVAEQVFAHRSLRGRIGGYLDAYRLLHASDPEIVPFIGMVLVEWISAGPLRDRAAPTPPRAALRSFLELLVDEAIERGEVHPDLDREGALLLLAAMGMGISLVSLDDPAAYGGMVDALERLVDGSMFTTPPSA